MNKAHELGKFIRAALEFSVYLAPTEYGLTLEELQVVGEQAGYGRGEISDAAQNSTCAEFSHPRLLPDRTARAFFGHFVGINDPPDFRNVDAFEFVWAQLQALARTDGVAHARIDRSVLLERGRHAQLPVLDLEAAITCLAFSNDIIVTADVVALSAGRFTTSPRAQATAVAERQRRADDPQRSRLYALVKDVIARRSDGRARHPEPFDAFADTLDRLGYAPFRRWWIQEVAELRHLDPATGPVGIALHSAALVEGALTFIVKHARSLNAGPFMSKDFDRPPNQWKIDDLVTSASTGRDSAVLDANTRTRAESLIKTRQRIHAGRMLVDHPQGVPDLRPEEARDARAIAEAVVRKVLDWLERFPPSGVAAGR